MNTLYNEIWERWEHAFDEIKLLDDYKKKVSTIKYSLTDCYDLENYSRQDFLPSKELQSKAPEDSEANYYEYCFDSEGRLILSSHTHQWNKLIWQGFYRYSDNLVEYIEFCLPTKTPSVIKVIKLKNNRKTSFQSFRLNGGGCYVSQNENGKKQIIEKIKNDGYSAVCSVKEFIYDKEQIAKANCLSYLPGYGFYKFEDIYYYDDAGILDEIKTIDSDGVVQLSYVQVDKNVKVDELSDRLAAEMAVSIIETLSLHSIEQPIATLELNYRSVSNYLPNLIPRSLSDWENAINQFEGFNVFENFFLTGLDRMINVGKKKFERIFQQFIQIIEDRSDFDLGSDLLLKVARILTVSKLNNQFEVADDFVAYAVDWELDSSTFDTILEKCGLAISTIERWKKNKWI